MTFENFLDLHDLLVNDIAGSSMIFIILATILIFVFCARFRFPNSVTIMAIGLFYCMLAAFYSSLLLPLMLLFALVFAGWQISRLLSRG
jgi:hypothetical protein